MNALGNTLCYSTFISGHSTRNTFVEDIAVNRFGETFITGFTGSSEFPVTPDAYQKNSPGSFTFLTRFSKDGDKLIYSTCFGGGEEEGKALAMRENGNIVIAGYTSSRNFPITSGAVDDSLTGRINSPLEFDAFVTKFYFDDGILAVNSSQKPSEFRISGIYPNPFNPMTTIDFFIPKAGLVSFTVYSVSGQKVYASNLMYIMGGHKQIRYNGKDSSDHMLSSGVYLFSLSFGKTTKPKKVLLMR